MKCALYVSSRYFEDLQLIVGKEVEPLQLTSKSDVVSISVSHLLSGSYSYSIIVNNRKTYSGKLIIRR